jgi:hypothetical protein
MSKKIRKNEMSTDIAPALAGHTPMMRHYHHAI